MMIRSPSGRRFSVHPQFISGIISTLLCLGSILTCWNTIYFHGTELKQEDLSTTKVVNLLPNTPPPPVTTTAIPIATTSPSPTPGITNEILVVPTDTPDEKVVPLSRDESAEVISVNLKTSVMSSVIITSYRPDCVEGHCTYRLYLDGPSLFSSFFHYNPSSSSYNLEFNQSATLFSNSTYSFLVILETKRNCSAFAGSFKTDFAVSYSTNSGGFQMGLRVSNTLAKIHTSLTSALVVPPIQQYEALSQCQYTARSTNQFTWIQRRVLEEAGGYDYRNALMLLPSKHIDPYHDLWHLFYQKDIHIEWDTTQADTDANDQYKDQWIQPYDATAIYVGVNCKQPLVTRSEIETLVKKESIEKIVFLGTSRIVHIYGMLKQYLGSSIRSKMSFGWLRSERGYKTETIPQLQKHFTKYSICQEGDSTSGTTLIVLSHGIWEARSQPDSKVFNFEIAQVELDWIRKKCSNFRYKIVLMTNPSTHPWDVRAPEEDGKLYYFDLFYSLANSRLESVKWEFMRLARQYDLPIVDLFEASLARRDMCADNIHYKLFDAKKKITAFGKKSIGIGNEVTFTFSQLTLAGIQQAFFSEV